MPFEGVLATEGNGGAARNGAPYNANGGLRGRGAEHVRNGHAYTATPICPATSYLDLLGAAQKVNLCATASCIGSIIVLNLALWAFLFGGQHSTSRHIMASKLVVGLAILGWLLVVLFALVQTSRAYAKTKRLFAVPGTRGTSADYMVTDFEQFTDVWIPVAIGFQATALVPFLSIIDRLSLLSEEADRLYFMGSMRLQDMLRESRVLSTDQMYTAAARPARPGHV
ncbi:hypothetical protein WJX81_001345 [Elliptochloris bilobata]|uniref:Uncharacterized protein n=1 Tax=Elliptochloris bilobata TaxID=381761 RepID=A0AAW1SHB9_9CHLO